MTSYIWGTSLQSVTINRIKLKTLKAFSSSKGYQLRLMVKKCVTVNFESSKGDLL